jgi:hypothetical protein
MLWVIGKTVGPPGDASRKPLVMAACECARLALPYVSAGEERPLRAIETAEAWCRDETTLDTVLSASAAASAASYVANAPHAAASAVVVAAAAAAYDAAAANAASAAAYVAAAAAAYDDAYAAASYAAISAAAAAYATDASAAAEQATRQRCADIVRRHFPKPPRIPRQPVGRGEG